MIHISQSNGVIILLVTFIVTLRYVSSRNKSTRLPPGPRGLPILGNVFQLDTERPWVTYGKWKKRYGPLVYLNMAGQPILVLNSQKAVQDLLDHRPTKYSDRPSWIVANEITGGLDLPVMRYGELWRRMRKASDIPLGVKASSNYHRVQTEQSILLAHGLLSGSENWGFHVERTSISIVLSLVYDMPTVQSLDEPSVRHMDTLLDGVSAAILPGAYLVDIFPVLRHLPLVLSKWRRDAQKDCQKLTSWLTGMFLPIKNRALKGEEQPPSFCATLAESQTRHGMSDEECAWIAGVLYGAGQETTGTVLKWFLLAMVSYPHVQEKAQDELDRVVGRARPPSFSDMKHLPYIQAIVKEILRWQTPLTVGVPHATSEDDYYEGYFIPKGTVCMANVMGLHRDPEIYGPDADEFRPERHLNDDGEIKDEKSQGHFTYGFGHRICVGRHVANNSLFIAIAIMLWAMKITSVKDEKGNSVKPDLEGAPGMLWRPKPFDLKVEPRFQDAAVLIQQARDDVMQDSIARSQI
ncbi:cytochrome P450 [Dendrothele bispora CBS 962.96]|uniref:Cytochrome P450 n=1 Tax=Dendrothele bispora (strain CBS 962.96) TaxID=1314807 RepID=A0A4S8LKZ8_DENBC|nr:cytochrome P450 [Dendrothele bispora CBS 962.96]